MDPISYGVNYIMEWFALDTRPKDDSNLSALPVVKTEHLRSELPVNGSFAAPRRFPRSLLPRAVAWFVSLTALTAGNAATAQTTTGDSFQWAGRIPAGATLRIYTVDGEIGVTPATGDQAEVRGERHDDGPAEHALVFQMLKDGDNVTVCAYDPDGGSCSTSGASNASHHGHWNRTARGFFTVKIPAGVRLVTQTGDGRIDIRGAAGGAEVSAASGNGDIRVADATGVVTARSGNGRIDIATSVGPVNATTGNGAIEVRVGSMPHPENMRIHTGNGSITLYLPSTFNGELEAHTGDGHVDSDFPLQVNGRLDTGHIQATLGSGGPARVELSTGDGDVRLRRLTSP